MSTLDEKIKAFKNEVGDRELNAAQGKIYHAFTKTKGSATRISVVDKFGNTVRIKIYSDKTSNGVQHILSNHYKTKVHWVTANEILNLYRIVETGDRYPSNGYTVYHRTQSFNGVKISTVLKFGKEGSEAVLKSFYSDREETKKPSRPACSSPRRRPHRKSGGGAQSRKRPQR